MPLKARSRRGAHAIEFALLLPVFILLMAALMEFGWLFYVRGLFVMATSQGCQSGARFHPADSFFGPVPMAEASILTYLQDRNVPCDTCSTLAYLEGTTPNTILRCELTGPYIPLLNMVPGLDSLSFTNFASARIELQQ